MRLSLDGLDARGFVLDHEAPEVRLSVAVREADALGGEAELFDGKTTLDARATRVALDSLAIGLQALGVRAPTGGELHGVTVRYEGATSTSFAVEARVVVTAALRLDGAAFEVTGALGVDALRVTQGEDGGEASGARVELANVTLTLKGAAKDGDASAPAEPIVLAADRLIATDLAIAWGRGGFRLAAPRIEGGTLRVSALGSQMELRSPVVSGVSVRGADVAIEHASVEWTKVTAKFSDAAKSPPTEPPRMSIPPPPSGPDLVAWSVLDALSGELNVDLNVDLAIPILGRRRATHRFRIPIDRGTLDYIRLEGDLSTLENTLLDFAVRGNALVLERGIPLLPTRGFGKPIVVWDLGPEDRALAEQRRVRLAILPHARLSSEAKSEGAAQREPSSRSGVALRRLGLLDIDADLSLAVPEPLPSGRIRPVRVERLRLRGNVFHDVEGAPRDGLLEGELEGAEIALVGLPLGQEDGAEGTPGAVGFRALRVARVGGLQVLFSGLDPKALLAEIVGLSVEGFALTS